MCTQVVQKMLWLRNLARNVMRLRRKTYTFSYAQGAELGTKNTKNTYVVGNSTPPPKDQKNQNKQCLFGASGTRGVRI